MKRVMIATTHRVNGMLEQSGVCGRRISYAGADIAEIMECDISNAPACNGTELVPGCDHVTLNQYLAKHGYKGRVVRKGWLIQ